MPTIPEPALERNQWTYSCVRAAFQRGVVGPMTFKVTCRNLGMSESEAWAEVALAEMEAKQR